MLLVVALAIDNSFPEKMLYSYEPTLPPTTIVLSLLLLLHE